MPAALNIFDGLRSAQFHLLYQPQVSSDGSRIVSVEALARWRHPTLGDISPQEFAPLAERCGAINELGAFVLERACLDALNWPAIKVGVNISGLQFRSADFAEQVLAVLARTGLPARRLEIEILESAIIENFDHAVGELNTLRENGVTIALDDFGTGYSSLTYLRRLPLDKLKIDKSFTSEIETVQSAAIVQAVVALARALGLKITAEGVETPEQQRFLRVCGCHFLQGFLFSAPVEAAEINRMLEITPPERRAAS